eukprot:CAMPEP_0173387366 /NCGR_PEP_ID=MMETSP1356-20130122/9885_1 /TAXON_ID=77927 ORGANISM="Hemiselmis virescens, Strain PCC157" /NCGR_SAMPLE_ID=MMETSP1356 /ASSEMBLY_ACC=CAM_ASM_000847 /LENGTH=329 /DNA_ID=CAMNT_0014343959 /DNA_START=234 /DNA_END=1223 /DNA_ORIENTATION=-
MSDDTPDETYSDAAFMLAPVEGDEMVSMISDNGEVSIRAITATGLVAGAANMQATSPVASAALGRTMICALMLAAGKKTAEMYGEVGQESVQIDVRGDGPLKQAFATADGLAEVRGYVAQPFVDLPPNSVGKLDVAGAVGKGIITVVRNNPMWKQPYSGITQIVSGEIAVDMAHYLTESEQTPSALGAGVLVDVKDETVIASGGWLVQMLPGATDETITQVEKNIGGLEGSPTDLIRSGKSARDICDILSQGLRDAEIYPAEFIKPRFACKCSMEKVYRTVALIPQNEMEEVLEEHGKIEVKCEFCKRKYALSGKELADAYKAVGAKDK